MLTPFREEHEIFGSSAGGSWKKNWLPTSWTGGEERLSNEVFRKVGEMGSTASSFRRNTGIGRRLPDGLGVGGGIDPDPLGGVEAGIGMHGLIVLPAVAKFGDEEQKRRLLIPGVKGEKIGALGLTEPVAGSDLARIRTVAKREGDHYVLNGSKTFITNGCRADFVLVLCKTSPEEGYKGFSTLIVEKGMPGFTQGSLWRSWAGRRGTRQN